MKTTTATVLAITALLAPSPVFGREAMLTDYENTGTRRLSKSTAYWRSIWFRCCNTDGVEEGSDSKDNENWRREDIPTDGTYADDAYCNCPVRGSDKVPFFGIFGSESYFDKWQKSCEDVLTLPVKSSKLFQLLLISRNPRNGKI